MTTARSLHTATALANGKVLIAGGYDQTMATLASAEVYDPLTGTFTPTGAMGQVRVAAEATRLRNGQILMVGGQDASGVAVASVELYDPITGTFSPTGSMLTPRLNPTVTLLADGRVLVVGGYEGTSHGTPLATAEIYQPKTGSFEPTGSMGTARRNHTATRLRDGTVLVTGGYNGNAVNDPEIFNPKSGLFKATAKMATPRRYPSATLLNNGSVLVVGGYEEANSGPLSTSESFQSSARNPIQRQPSFVPSVSLQTPRGRHTATDLGLGRILVAGGYDGQLVISSGEVIDSVRGTVTATGLMSTPRWRHTATMLPNGNVLIAGGADADAALASAELFIPTGRFLGTAGIGPLTLA